MRGSSENAPERVEDVLVKMQQSYVSQYVIVKLCVVSGFRAHGRLCYGQTKIDKEHQSCRDVMC